MKTAYSSIKKALQEMKRSQDHLVDAMTILWGLESGKNILDSMKKQPDWDAKMRSRSEARSVKMLAASSKASPAARKWARSQK